MAGPEGGHEQAEIREDRGEKADDANQGALRWLPRCVQIQRIRFQELNPCAHPEEFGIYLNYVRKLGFEETPDYDFLRELFTKVMRSNGDADDGVFDWNLLNG